MKIWLALAFLLLSCAKKHPAVGTLDAYPLLRAKRDLYIKLSNEQGRPDGFVAGCDGLLFSALAKSGGIGVELWKAELEPGRWLRRPISHGSCYPFFSESEISRDMILGLLTYATKAKDYGTAQRIIDYAKKHGNTLGDGSASRTLITPQLYGTLYELAYRGGGENNPTRFIGLDLNSNLSGFAAHLQVLHIYIRYLLAGASDKAVETLGDYAADHYKNAFFQAVYHLSDGDQSVAYNLLMDSSVFPSDRLPGSSEYCEPYRWQRDGGADWLPCKEEGKIHTGADFVFVASIILGD